MNILDRATRFLFFTGKGGVGKTSMASATAVGLAARGRRVLLVSTDPASNLDQVFGVSLGNLPQDIPGIDGLSALNIDPEVAAREYRERIIGPYRTALPAETVAGMEEQLSGACTVEVAAFDEFTSFIVDGEYLAAFDHVIFDTAPTGHTLRLLQLPAAWSGFLASDEGGQRGASCLGPLSGLKTQQEKYAATVKALSDPALTTLVLVTRPARSAIVEAARSGRELAQLGLSNAFLIINGLFTATDRNDPVARAIEERGQLALEQMPEELRSLPRMEVALRAHNIVGLAALRTLLTDGIQPYAATPAAPETAFPIPGLDGLAALIDEFGQSGHGLIMVMGKGGVGKTTIAAAIAVELARRGLPVHLTTTDPAAHLTQTIAVGEDDLPVPPSLRISRIDPAAETAAYRRQVIERTGKGLDAAALALLEEDLLSPCTEEVAVFHAFARIVSGARKEIVVMDTAPTGHTLLLLDATGAYHREVTRNSGAMRDHLVTPLMRLRNPEYTRILIVTLPETTPVLEAAQLQQDLRRAEIEPHAWIINQSLAASRVSDPLLRQRALNERELIRDVVNKHARQVALVPLLTTPPVGIKGLQQLFAVEGSSSSAD